MTDTRHLTPENVSLRPGMYENLYVVDLHTDAYAHERKVLSVGALVGDYNGGYMPFSWQSGTHELSTVGMPMSDAIRVLTQHLSPYTFTS